MYQNNDSQKGAFTVFMAVALVMLIGIAGLAIDLGYGLVVKSELQNAADTGSLAGTRELALMYEQGETNCSGTNCYWGDRTLADSETAKLTAKVNEFTQQNLSGGVATVVASSDIVMGKWDPANGTIIPKDTGVMALQVKARRDESSNGVVSTWLSKVLGNDSMSISATATATLSALGKVYGGGLGIPVGISQFWFTAKNSPCGKKGDKAYGIRLYPTGPQNGETMTNAQGCAGWHTYTDYPASAAKLGTVLDGLRTGSYSSPVTTAGETIYNFTGGVLTSQFSRMKALFEANKKGNSWETVVPVYEASDCSNPSGPIKIVGFATAYIYNVVDNVKGEKFIDATVMCNVVDSGEGGGQDYGTLLGRPGMVE